MAVPIGVLPPDHHMRPPLQRTRSHSSPSQNDVPSDPKRDRSSASRPQHVRAHSLLPPDAVLSPEGSTPPYTQPSSQIESLEPVPSEKPHRSHLPGKHHLHHYSRSETQDSAPAHSHARRRDKLHRYTQSLAQQHHHTNSHAHHNAGSGMQTSPLRSRRSDLRDETPRDALPNLVAGLNADRKRGQHRNETAADAPGADALSLAHPTTLSRVPTSRSYRGFAAADATHLGYGYGYEARPTDALRRRATSDPRAPSYDPQSLGAATQPKTQIELDLERAARLRQQRKFALTAADVRARDKQIAVAEDELRESLSAISQRGMEITRRLDYGYYNLLEKVGNLAGIIQSFQSLSTQSGHLITNLESEISKTDEHIQSKAGHLRSGFDERDGRVRALEARGREVQRKAEEMGQRLERARTSVEQWELRETQRRKVWRRFVARMWAAAGCVVALIVALLAAKEFWFGSGAGAGAALAPPRTGLDLGNGSGILPLAQPMKDSGSRMEAVKKRVPEDVRLVLVEIEERNRNGYSSVLDAVDDGTGGGEEGLAEPDALKAFNDL